MSAQNKQGVVAAKSTGIVVGDGRHHRRRINLHLRVVGLVIALLIILGGIAWGVVVVVQHFHGSKKRPSIANNSNPNPGAPNLNAMTPEQKADYYVLKGQFSDAQAIYDAQLKVATTPQQKADAYTAKATTAYSAKDYATAKQFEMQADQLAPTAGTAQFLGDIAVAQGDKSAAAGYYQTALNRLDKSSPTYGYEANKIQAKLNEAKQ